MIRTPSTGAAVLAALLLTAHVLAGSATARTIHVPADETTIQAGVLAAAPGDTVLVAPGTYQELVQMRNGVVLKSAAGPDSTILQSDGVEEDVLIDRVVECLEGVDRSTVIEGFHFDSAQKPGTALYCEKGSPTVRGNVFTGFGWAINLRESDPLIEDNIIEQSKTFGIMVFASSPEIYRNDFRDNIPRALTIGGKKSHPVVGGSAENANRFYNNETSIFNESRNDINATYNDWGWETTAEMDREGFPSDIVKIIDGTDRGTIARGKGTVDYRHWIRPEEPAAQGATSFRRWFPLAAALLMILVFVAAARRRATAG